METKKNNMLMEMVCNVILPSVILMKLSGPENLGTVGALIVALAFPIIYGGYELIRFKKFNFISLLGFISVLMTGGIGLLELDPQWLAIKEAFIPGVIGLIILGSSFTRSPIVSKLIFNKTIFNIELINSKLEQNQNKNNFDRRLIQSNYLFASTFLFSSIMNYVLATIIVTSPAGTEAFNTELGKLTLMSYPAIAIPSMIMMIGVFYFLWRQLKKLTQLENNQIFNM